LFLAFAGGAEAARFHDLLDAARLNDMALARQLLAAGVDVDGAESGFPDSYSPLQWAARHGNVALIELLLRAGADTERRDFNGDRALLWAAGAGQAPAIAALVAGGSPAQSADDPYGQTPLMIAARGGWLDAARVLLEAGADPNARNRSGDTALHGAALSRNTALVELLLDAGADPNAVSDILHETPLHIAAAFDNAAVVRALLAARATAEIADGDGRTPLTIAAYRGLPENVAALLAAGANAARSDQTGTSAFAAAIAGRTHEWVDNDAAAALLAPVTPDATAAFADVVEAGMSRTALILIEAGADPDTPGALAGAARMDDPAVLEALLAAGADIARWGNDALVAAAGGDRRAAVDLLLERGVSRDAADATGIVPVQAAAEGGHLDMLKFLLAAGAAPVPPETVRLATIPVDPWEGAAEGPAALDWRLIEAQEGAERLRARQIEARAILAAAFV